MRCEDVLTVLQRTASASDPARREATEHLSSCEDCRNAAHAVAMLKADRDLPIPRARQGAFQDAIRAAVSANGRVTPSKNGFWLGVGVGAALAASVAAAAFMMLRPLSQSPPPGAPAVTLAINEERDVNVALSSPEPLSNAEIHVAVSGDIGLWGFAEQRELRWNADLDRGVNQLTLPIIALGPHGGQVLVEVQHGDKRRAFVVDVRTIAPSAKLPSGGPQLVAASVPDFGITLERDCWRLVLYSNCGKRGANG
jgi:hypothetical protein